MYPIDPGEGWGKMVIIGGDQAKDYEPLYSRIHPNGNTITRWRLTESERERLIDGADLYLSILQFGQPFQPVNLFVGEPNDG